MVKKHFIVALIGGIASGKSSVLHFFQSLGIDTISADVIAKQILQKGKPAYDAILNHLGQHFLLENKELDRSKIRHYLITQPDFKIWLEQLTHPIIREKIIHDIHQSKTPYVMVEIPLLKNRKDYPISSVLYVQTSEEQQKKYLQKRGLNDFEIKRLLELQTPKSIQTIMADDILQNDSDLKTLQEKVQALHEKYLKLISTNINGFDT